jgi:L-amino acid N-acyltransferase YncA
LPACAPAAPPLADLEAVSAIYNAEVLGGVATFDTEPRTGAPRANGSTRTPATRTRSSSPKSTAP